MFESVYSTNWFSSPPLSNIREFVIASRTAGRGSGRERVAFIWCGGCTKGAKEDSAGLDKDGESGFAPA